MRAVLARGWPVFLAAIVGNAVVQALTSLPQATPGPAVGFVLLAAASGIALVVSLAVVVARVRGAADAGAPAWRWTDGVAALAGVLVIALAGLVSSWLVTPAIAVVLIVLAGVAVGRGVAGFGVFRHTPGRAILLLLATLAVVGLLWLAALLLGFFVTGWLAAGLTWLAFGVAGVLLLCGWTSLARRAVR
ncbi:MAG: hypothetical protein J0J05_08225 [Microbacterium sp.]|uniref:hypothetical protein n=1 Tax=Microbacterium sp. TaxID=51671 RepID=UPI001AC61BA0|nr:hypothetical protein [Microbacterium sp.]MBN9153954.1 hypothetical protein [Microbacterium sp.]